jgi:hypothetical protein
VHPSLSNLHTACSAQVQGSRVVGIDFGSLIEMSSYLDLGFAQDYPRLAFAFGLRLSRHGSLQLWGDLYIA